MISHAGGGVNDVNHHCPMLFDREMNFDTIRRRNADGSAGPFIQGDIMSEAIEVSRRPRFWIGLIAIIIGLIFLYFYAPFETFLIDAIPNIHFTNVIFWFASTVGVIAYVVSHWSSFRQNLSVQVTSLDVTVLVFDTLQISILIAVIFLAGATLQAVAMLALHLMGDEPIIGSGLGENLLAIVLLVILALLFYLLHHMVRAFRDGWTTRRAPPRRTQSSRS